MSKQHIHIGVEDSERGFERFTEAWHKAEDGESGQTEIHLNFEDFSMLASVLTPKRLELMKMLRQNGPFSVRALSKKLERLPAFLWPPSYCCIQRTKEGLLVAPWDVIDAHVRLVA